MSAEEAARHRRAMEEYARDPDALPSVVAHQEQIERAWADAQAIADGDAAAGSWRRVYWRFVIARGLKSLREGRVKVWNKALDEALRKKLLKP